jgi:LPXTG-site transpeptidase (sortase) family protein
MHPKILLKWSLLIVGSAGIAFFCIITFFPVFDMSGKGFYVKSVASIVDQTFPDSPEGTPVRSIQSFAFLEQASLGQPIRLTIPKINVDAAFDYVGLTDKGAMDISKNQDDVAWFDLGPRPGENGSAVVAGHYGLKDGKASVFDDLYKLRQGDKLYVKDDKGATISFVVRESRRYDPDADASAVFGSNDGKSHLNLITCEGVWDEVAKSYSERLVVFTDKE